MKRSLIKKLKISFIKLLLLLLDSNKGHIKLRPQFISLNFYNIEVISFILETKSSK